MAGTPASNASNAISDLSIPNVNTLWARVIVDEFARAGLRSAVISPGSRSAPLVFELNRHPAINDFSIIDERSAGFLALGLARSLKQPVALLCTSGTAAANFFPAICEAAAAGIPLLVLTADRPRQDHDCGTQQVMEQNRLFGEHVLACHEFCEPGADAEKLAYARSLAARAIQGTQTPRSGPVHLNMPFRKPLEPLLTEPGGRDSVPAELLREARLQVRGRTDGSPWIRLSSGPATISGEAIERLAARVQASRRPLLIAGSAADGPAYRQALRDFARHAAIPVLAEPASGLRHWNRGGAGILGAGDLIAASHFYSTHGKPDLVLHTGHAPLSWSLQTLLAESPDAIQIAIGDSPALPDPGHQLAEHISGSANEVFERTRQACAAADHQRAAWLDLHRRAESAALATLEHALAMPDGLSAPGIWNALGGLLSEGSGLFFSSSMLVRHLDSFMCAHRQSLDVYFNRGLNGIDGIVSTAAGIASGRRLLGLDRPLVLVIGDVALRHDLAALVLALELELDLTVIVIDNDGGEIFEYLPSAGFGEVHRKHFATSGSLPIDQILPRKVGISEPRTRSDFERLVSDSLKRPGLQLIRCVTGRTHDRHFRSALFEQVAASIDRIDSNPPE